MPPMANGGMQRGLYGRASLQRKFLTAAFGRVRQRFGHSHRGQFRGLRAGEDLVQWSCPGDNNALCAYTPSRRVISVGKLAVGPHHGRRCTAYPDDSRHGRVLDVIVADDADTRGDLWRSQPWIRHPRRLEGCGRGPTGRSFRDTAAIRRYWRASDSVFPRMYHQRRPWKPALARTGYRRGHRAASRPGGQSSTCSGRGRRPDRRRG